MQTFWANVTKLMALRKVPQARLAEYLERSQSSLSNIISGKRPTYYKEMEKVAEFFGMTVTDLLNENFIEVLAKEQKAVSKHSSALSQDVPMTDKEIDILKQMKLDPAKALKLHRIFLISSFPPSKEGLSQFVHENTVGEVITTHGGGDVFAYQLTNRDLEPLCSEGGILVFDAKADIKDGDFVGLLYKGLPLIRKLFYRGNSLIFQSASGQNAPDIIESQLIDLCFKVVECIKRM